MKELSCADRLSALALESLDTRSLCFDLIYVYNILLGEIYIEWSSMLEFAPMSITRGHYCKLFVSRSWINTGQQFFCNRIVSVLNILPAGPEYFCSCLFSKLRISIYLYRPIYHCSDNKRVILYRNTLFMFLWYLLVLNTPCLARVVKPIDSATMSRSLLASLHWLPIRQRVTFKLVSLP